MATVRAAKRGKVTGYIVLTGYAEKEGNQYVSICRELGTASCGDTPEEALRNLDEAITVHLDALEETGEIGRFLRERNIRVHAPPPLDELTIRVPPNKIMSSFQHRVAVDRRELEAPSAG